MSRVFLIGMPGAGKSTLGEKLAPILNLPFYDLDELIELREQRSIDEIFSVDGESHFRTLERRQLKDITESHSEMILACGGGTPCFSDNLQFMKRQGVTIYLEADLNTLIKRVGSASHRPLIHKKDPEALIPEMLHKRESYYKKAHLSFTTGTSIDRLVTQIRAFRM